MNECEIFMAAVAIGSPARRSAFLDRECRPSRTSRTRIESLLASHSDSGSLLEHPAIAAPKALDFDQNAARPGESVGPYELLEQIGEGGMGVVFRAEQREPVQRTVALKLIKPGMDSRQVIARFAAEQQALERMDHPNIARVLDAGTTASGRYFAMELVDGIPITKYCDDNRLTPRARLELFVQICQAVQHAHQKGVIHRDLKPSNVLVALYDGRPKPKIIDFGVAKAAGPKLTEATLTEFGQVVGTLEYMSPEQAELSQHDVDTRSDIYSLGILLYELLTGTTPLERRRLRDTSLLDGLRLVREEEPPRPSCRLTLSEALPTVAANRSLEPKKLNGLVRGELDWIAMKCLEKVRDCRYATANSLASDIQRYLRDEPVLACPPTAVYRFRKFARKYRLAIAVALGFAVVLVSSAIVSTILAVRASQATAEARANEERAVEKEREAIASAQQAQNAADAERIARQKEAAHRERAEAISGFLKNAFRNPHPARDGDAITMAEVLAQSAREVENFEDSPTKGDLLHIIAQAYYDMGFYGEAIPLWEEVRTYLIRTFGPDHPTTLAISGNLAVAYKKAGQLAKARPLLEELLERMRRTLGAEHRQTRITMVHLAETYRKSGRVDDALPISEEAFRLSKVIRGLDHSETRWAMKNLAEVYAANGLLTEAAREFTRLFQNYPTDHRSALRAAVLSLAIGDRENYDAVCRQMLDRFARTKNGWAASRTALACLLSSSPVGETQQLERLAESATANFDKGTKTADRAIGCRTRGLAAYRRGDFRGALEWCRKSRDLEAKRSKSISFLATNLVIEAMAWRQLGNPAKARTAFDDSARMIQQRFPDAPVKLGSGWFNWLMHDQLRREAAELLDLVDATDLNRSTATIARIRSAIADE